MIPLRSDVPVSIRPLQKNEAGWYAESLDTEIVRWSREEPIANAAAWWVAGGRDRLAIACCGEPVGAAKVVVDSTRAEISYWVAADHRGHGYASAALTLLTSLERERHPGLPIELEIHPENSASIRVAMKAGYVFIGLRRSCGTCADSDGNVAIYRYAG